MIPVWFSLTLKFMSIAVVAVCVGLWQGAAAGCAAACAGLGLLHAVHVNHLSRMERWLINPSADTLPDPSGTWSLVFAGVYRALRLEARKRDAVDRELELFTQAAQALSECLATGVLLATIHLGLRNAAEKVPLLVALIVTAGYWFTASTFFANPAVTIARSFSNTFAGIQPANVAGFIGAQLIACVAACALLRGGKRIS